MRSFGSGFIQTIPRCDIAGHSLIRVGHWPSKGLIMQVVSIPQAPVHHDSGIAAPTLPRTGLIRQSLLLKCLPFSKSTLWRWVKAGLFPAPVRLSVGITAWRAEDVQRWIAEREGGAEAPAS